MARHRSQASSARMSRTASRGGGTQTDRIGKYRVLVELGQGGMSNVFLAMAKGPSDFSKLIVLKALRPHLAIDPLAVSSFMEEARLAARLNHPNIVQTYDVGQEDDHHVIVMEFLEGQSLSAVLYDGEHRKDRPPLSLLLRVVIGGLEGLHHAHELNDFNGLPLGLVHRDVSPQNIFVTYDGQAKVLDFGIAKAASQTVHTADGVIKGKIAYMAPEQLLGTETDRRADLFSVGVVLWECVAGRPMWKGVKDIAIAHHLTAGEVPEIATVVPDIDPELRRIMYKAMALRPEDRYSQAPELQADLERFAETAHQNMRSREIARYMVEQFDDFRQAIRTIVDRRIQELDESPSPQRGPLTFNDTDDALLASPAPQWSGQYWAQKFLGRRKRMLGVALASIALILTLVSWRFIGRKTFAASEPTANVSASAAPKHMIVLRLVATPSEAVIHMNDEMIPNPSVRTLPADGSRRIIRAEAFGYKPSARLITLTESVAVHFALERETPADSPTKTAPTVPERVGRTPVFTQPPRSLEERHNDASPGAARSIDCSNPFYVDARGIKAIRQECR